MGLPFNCLVNQLAKHKILTIYNLYILFVLMRKSNVQNYHPTNDIYYHKVYQMCHISNILHILNVDVFSDVMGCELDDQCIGFNGFCIGGRCVCHKDYHYDSKSWKCNPSKCSLSMCFNLAYIINKFVTIFKRFIDST